MELHFLRPWWFLGLFVLLGLGWSLWRFRSTLQGWSDVCDSHLLAHLVQKKGEKKRLWVLASPLVSLFFMLVALAGPAWYQLPVATYKPIQPRVLVLDMSEHMLDSDLTPNRLSRAKFKIHDLLARKGIGQFGLIAYSGEPFVVSPLTDDGQTISSLLSVLTPDVMPVGGQNLEKALDEAAQLIQQAGYVRGQLLVLTSDTPSAEAIERASKLADKGIDSSIMPVLNTHDLNPLFKKFAYSGRGEVLPYKPSSDDLERWITTQSRVEFKKNNQDEIPLWRDEGRWFLLPALLFFLRVFQRGWLQRMAS
jgi:Ca-activated chloride channel family protein